MRRAMLIAAVLGPFGLAWAAPARAGLYTTDLPLPGPAPNSAGEVKPLPFDYFFLRGELGRVRNLVQLDKQSEEYRKRFEALQARDKAGSLTTADRIDLGEALIRQGKYGEAIPVLLPACRTDFRAASNMATAQFLFGEINSAGDYLGQALDLWPEEAAGLTPEQLRWYRNVEMKFKDLIRCRRVEAAQAVGRPKPVDAVDALFPVAFVGADGTYQAGGIAAAEQAKLPPDALAMVQQMVLWLPADTRLLWLLGELYNADGNLEAAKSIFENAADQGFSARAMRQHKQVIDETIDMAKAEAARAEAADRAARDQAAADAKAPPPPLLEATPRNLAIGGLAAVIVLAFICLQIREFVRRRARGSGARNCCN